MGTRGTSNGNVRGSSYDRLRRKWWLIKVFQSETFGPGWTHCYRCEALLCILNITVDRIRPGCQGGTYRRDNIRPACGPCNSETGGSTRGNLPRERREPHEMKINEKVRQMHPPRYTRAQAAEAIGKDVDTLRRWKRKGVFVPSDRHLFGQLYVDLYTNEDLEVMRKIARSMKPGRKSVA